MDEDDIKYGADALPEEEQMVNADEAFAEEVEDALEEEVPLGPVYSSLVSTVTDNYSAAQRVRDSDESRWLDAYQNYRGFYSKNVKFTENEKSRVFVKVTKTKVLAAYGQLIDVLFGAEKFPISIKNTKVPEGAPTFAHLGTAPAPSIEGNMGTTAPSPAPVKRNPFDVGFAGDGLELSPGATFEDVTAGLDKRLKEATLQSGHSMQGEPQVKPAHDAAKKMEKLIHDQIEESNGATELRSAIFEAALLGTGIIKGPFTYHKTLHKWEKTDEGRKYKPEKVKVPRIEFCSVFDFFPDPNARSMEEAEWVIQRHKMSRSQLRALKDRPYFKKDELNYVLKQNPDYQLTDYEQALASENGNYQPSGERYEVLEYWGTIDRKSLEGLLPELDDELEEVQVNAWVCMGRLLRVVLNPFTPKRIPYLSFDYERNPYSFFGIGVAENMSDSQQIMNGHARMAIDNLALAGNMVFDIDENALAPGQTMEIYPGRIFKRQSGVPGQAVYGVKFPSTANENMQMFREFRQIADEATGIPSYSHGQTGVTGTTRTAAGMSMLMGASALNIKTVVKNVDDFLLRPLGEAYFQWNMSFYEGDLEIYGDLEVKAGGAASLMQNEIQSQRLTAFGNLLANPAIAPFVKIPAYIKAFVESLELDPEELVNDQDQAAIYASIIGKAGGIQPPAQGQPPTGLGDVGGVPTPAGPGNEQFAGVEQALAGEEMQGE